MLTEQFSSQRRDDCKYLSLAKRDRAEDPLLFEKSMTSPPYGDNTTTIPYGQFSYLALQSIPKRDLPTGFDPSLLENTHALDTASLGGSLKDAAHKREAACLVSPHFADFVEQAQR